MSKYFSEKEVLQRVLKMPCRISGVSLEHQSLNTLVKLGYSPDEISSFAKVIKEKQRLIAASDACKL